MNHQTACVLAVGSELLQGQILERNSKWLSERLFTMGIDVRAHLTVDDVHQDILDAIEYLSSRCELLFVTGGLGPTSDDLTRDAVSAWAGQKLVYDEDSWQHVQAQFARLGRTPPETNRQQCFFPEGARVMTNSQGTANGFALTAKGLRIFVLPGPPREIEAIWNDHLEAEIKGLLIHPPPKMRKWRTIGIGESHLAEIVEPIVAKSGAKVAYRAHAPYVEIKVVFGDASAARENEVCRALDEALGEYVFERDSEDHAQALGQFLGRCESIAIFDFATGGRLAEALGPVLRHLPEGCSWSLLESSERSDDPASYVEECLGMVDDTEVALVVAGYGADGSWAAGLKVDDRTEIATGTSPFLSPAWRARNDIAVAALAIRTWAASLERGVTPLI